MKSKTLWTLIMLNAALLALFVWRVMPDNAAYAQQQPQRGPAAARGPGAAAAPVGAPGDYLMVPTELNGISSGVVIIVDQVNGQLIALTENGTGAIDTMEKVDLRQAFAAGRAGGAGPARRGRGY
jgi:hypothetical protein